MVAELPKQTELAIYVPHLDLALSDLHGFISTLAQLDTDLTQLFGFEAIGPALEPLLTPAGLAAIGVDAGGSAVIVPPRFGEPMVFAMELQNRPRFQSWLEALAPDETRRVSIGGEEASVLFPNRERPIACLTRRATAYCQVGAAPGPDPIAPLRATVSIQPPALGTVAAIGRAYGRLREGAHAYVFVHGEPAARTAPELALAWAERNHRFDGKKKITEAAQALAPRIKHAAEMIEGAAGGLYLGSGGIAFESEVSVGERGVKLLRDLTVATEAGALIPRWFETPALARVLLRVRSDRAEQLLKSAGVEVPSGSLSGTLALLLFGVDAQCSAAKKQDASGPLGWAFLLPSAIAVGLRGPTAADAVQNMLIAKLGDQAPEDPAGADGDHDRVKARAPVRTEAFGSTFEVQVLDEIALFGTGPGSGAAAMRRLRSLSADSRAGEPRAFVHAAIHPREIDAALEAGNISRDNRRELLMVEAMRRKLRPLLQQVDAIELVARANESERRVTVDLEVRRP